MADQITATDRNDTEFTVGAMVNYGARENVRVTRILPLDRTDSKGRPVFRVWVSNGHQCSYSNGNGYRPNYQLRVVDPA